MNARIRPQQCSPHKIRSVRRGGYLYVAVLGSALLIAVMGASAITISRVHLQTTTLTNGALSARSLALSGVELGVARIRSDANWRSTLTHGTESAAYALGGGTVSFRVEDLDGNLADNTTDWVTVIGTGRVDNSVQSARVQLMPDGPAFTCLNTALSCTGTVECLAGTPLFTDQILHSGDKFRVQSGRYVEGSIECVGKATVGGTITGTVNDNVTAHSRPDLNVLNYYLRVGTTILASSLPTTGSNRWLYRAVLSPGANPYGATTNAAGVYVLDLAGQNLTIEDSRIVGTLVVINCPQVVLKDALHWEPAVRNFPALLTTSELRVCSNGQGLTEYMFGGSATNFNPASTPYAGTTDTDLLDDYPNRVTGLVWTSGNLWLDGGANHCVFAGQVSCATINPSSPAQFDYDSTFAAAPPPGFRSGTQMSIVPGSWE